jgi:hypothetical protein
LVIIVENEIKKPEKKYQKGKKMFKGKGISISIRKQKNPKNLAKETKEKTENNSKKAKKGTKEK